MIYLESGSTDPAFNLALEQYAFDTLAVEGDIFMLWQNSDAVIVGLHQNTAEEISNTYVAENNINVVRRLSGGGAVFHDSGNLNYTFIKTVQGMDKFDFRASNETIVGALRELGVNAVAEGRNDITVDGRKISGSAGYLRDGRLMHHGTILFDTDLEKMSEALRIPDGKYSSKSVKSIRARVTNLRGYLSREMTLAELHAFLRRKIAGDIPAYVLTDSEICAVEDICKTRYATWEWNYGRSPDYGIQRRRRIEGFGTIRLSMRVDNGKIVQFATDGDYFGSRTCADLDTALRGVHLERSAVSDALRGIELSKYYEGLTLEELVNLITGS